LPGLLDWDLTPGTSKYPIKEGYIIKGSKTYWKYNKHVSSIIEHNLYYWIMKIYKWDGHNRKFTDRKVRTTRLYVPVPLGQERHCIIYSNIVRFRSLTKFLADGCTVLSDHCMFNGTKASWKRFYRKIQDDIGRPLV